MLSVHNGDCFLINTNGVNILVDGGLKGTYMRSVKPCIRNLQEKNEKLQYIILTHIDDDHIGGIIKLFEDEAIDKSEIKEVIFNSGWSISKSFNLPYRNENEIPICDPNCKETSFSNANTLERKLKDLNLLESTVFICDKEIQELGIKIISPDKETLMKLYDNWEVEKSDDKTCSCAEDDYDKSVEELMKDNSQPSDVSLVNRSSIAFLIKDSENSVLMLGDAHIDVIVQTLIRMGYSKENKLTVDYIKLSHHGSANNINDDFLNIVQCEKFLISTNGSRFKHPNKRALVKIIQKVNNTVFYFNSDVYKKVFTQKEINKYGITVRKVSNGQNVGDESE